MSFTSLLLDNMAGFAGAGRKGCVHDILEIIRVFGCMRVVTGIAVHVSGLDPDMPPAERFGIRFMALPAQLMERLVVQ